MSLQRVERVTNLLPHEQVALIASYLGWIPSFIVNLKLGRIALQTRSLAPYVVKQKYIGREF